MPSATDQVRNALSDFKSVTRVEVLPRDNTVHSGTTTIGTKLPARPAGHTEAGNICRAVLKAQVSAVVDVTVEAVDGKALATCP